MTTVSSQELENVASNHFRLNIALQDTAVSHANYPYIGCQQFFLQTIRRVQVQNSRGHTWSDKCLLVDQNHCQERDRSQSLPEVSCSRTCLEPDPSPVFTHTTSHEATKSDQAEDIQNTWHKPTLASLMARSGRVIRGKEYMAPCTGLQLMPGTVFRISSVSLAFSAKALRMPVRSYTRQRKRTEKRKKTGILANAVNWIIHS